jgi:hypothetical protein
MTLAKKIVGRKRHIAVDTHARLLMVNLTPADISDSAGVQGILEGVRKRWPWVKHLFADGAYDRLKIKDKATDLDFAVEIVRRSDDQKSFETSPRFALSVLYQSVKLHSVGVPVRC